MGRYRIVLHAIVAVQMSDVEASSPSQALAIGQKRFDGHAIFDRRSGGNIVSVEFTGDFDGVVVSELDGQGGPTRSWAEDEDGSLKPVSERNQAIKDKLH
jgi:hypothetical protein